MGLFLSKGLLDLMGGHISVDSEPDVGSTFTVEVPCTLLPDDSPLDPEEDIRHDQPSMAGASSFGETTNASSADAAPESATASSPGGRTFRILGKLVSL